MPAPGRRFSRATGSPAPAAASSKSPSRSCRWSRFGCWPGRRSTSAIGWPCRWPSPPPASSCGSSPSSTIAATAPSSVIGWPTTGSAAIAGVLTFTPYDVWRRAHATHHASTGNLDRRGLGDVETLTVRGISRALVLGPAALSPVPPSAGDVRPRSGLSSSSCSIACRSGSMRDGWRPWVSTMATNLAIALIVALLIWLDRHQGVPAGAPADPAARGLGRRLAVLRPAPVRAHDLGERREWNLHDAALHGSSHYDLPAFLRWFTANIGMHHVHHLNSRIPYYRLPRVLRDHPELRDVGRLTLLAKLPLRAPRAVGRDATPPGLVPRGPRSAEASAHPLPSGRR